MFQIFAAFSIALGILLCNQPGQAAVADPPREADELVALAGVFDVDLVITLPTGEKIQAAGSLVRTVDLDGSFLREGFTHNIIGTLGRIEGYSHLDPDGRLCTVLVIAGRPGSTMLTTEGPAGPGAARHAGVTDCYARKQITKVGLEWGPQVAGVRKATLTIAPDPKIKPLTVDLTIKPKKS
jgi:hypothetical protein